MTSPDFKLTPVEKIEGKRLNKRGKGDGGKRKPLNFELISAEKPEQRKRYKPVSSSEQKISVDNADIKDIAHAMSGSHFGSFTEYLVSKELDVRGHEVVKSHGELKDLLVDGFRTDVKGHRHLAMEKVHRHVFPFKVPETNYIHVVFLSDGVVYYDEDDRLSGELSYTRVKELWSAWPSDKKYRVANANSLRKKRNQVKKDFNAKLENLLGQTVYVVHRGSEITRGVRHFQKGPDNLSLENIRNDEKLMVYVQFVDNLVVVDRVVAFKVEDVRIGQFPMTTSWGRLDKIGKQIVVTEEMWDKRENYPTAYFGEGIDIEEILSGIADKFKV
jgi:hypothetical protein